MNREFFDDKVSRLVNISFEANPALSIYQKNAILSYRSNQNKVLKYIYPELTVLNRAGDRSSQLPSTPFNERLTKEVLTA